MFENIVLSGGTALLPGLRDRLQKEIALIAPKNVKTKVISFDQPQQATWVGGSILSTSPSFAGMCISQRDYTADGPRVMNLHRI
jgi:actin-related protein